MGLFKSFTCPVCNRTLSFLQKTSTQINGDYLCGECAKKRGIDMLKMCNSMDEYNKKVQEFDNHIIVKNKLLKERGKIFSPTVSYDSIYFDDKNKMFSFPENSKVINTYNIINYDELVAYDVIENGNLVTSGGLGKALIGGALFGLAGTIAGGTSKKISETCSQLQLKITTSNEATPIIYMTFIDTNIEKSSIIYKQFSKNIQDILSKFEIITNSIEKNNNSITFSKADEIKKFKELLDIGAITKEEYNKKKKELLK